MKAALIRTAVIVMPGTRGRRRRDPWPGTPMGRRLAVTLALGVATLVAVAAGVAG